ncbi:MAG: RNA polymerase sigma factor [Dermatophilaceae bacterium]
MSPPWSADRFDDLFHDTAPRVRAYLRRRVQPDIVDDLLIETFTVAWTRLDRVPERPLPWLLTVAHHMARRHWRSQRRAHALWTAAVREQWQHVDSSAETAVLHREDVLTALGECSELEREALLLTAWDGLTASEAATVAGCTTRAFTVRLSRARARFDRAMAHDPPRPRTGHLTTLAPMEQP